LVAEVQSEVFEPV